MPRILCPVLVGRESELAQLDAAVDAALHGRGGALFVTGPAGVGKSRLAAELIARAAARNIATIAGRCVPSATPVPYRPVAEALLGAPQSATLRDARELAPYRPALGWMVPAWRDPATPLAPESPVVVADALFRTLEYLAARSAVVLLVEDAQWSDPETLHAVEYLADHAHTKHVLCLCTLRDDGPSEGRALVERLDSRRAADVVRLSPLTAAQVSEMAGRSLGTPQPPASIDALLRESADGMPFLVEELMAAAAAAGFLTRANGRWTAADRVEIVVPASFAGSVLARVETLGPTGRRFLGAAALLGRNFDWRIASDAAGCSAQEAHALLDGAIAAQLLAVQNGEFLFRHALTRDAIVRELLPDERVRLATRCLDLLEAARPTGGGWLHLAADLAEMAGEPDRAARHLLTAGRAALAGAALTTALSALNRASSLAGDSALRLEVLTALAEACSATGDIRATQDAARALLGALAAAGAPPARRAEAHLLTARCAVTAAYFDVAAGELRQARDCAAADGDLALDARITAVDAHLAIGESRIADAMTLALRAADTAERTAQPEVVVEALEVATRCARMHDMDDAVRIAERALRVATDAGLALWRMRALYQLGVVEMFRQHRVDKLRAAQTEAERLGALATATTLNVEIAAGLEASFQIDECRRTCERCIAMASVLELRIVESLAHLFIAVLDAGRGSRAAMEAAIARSAALGGDNPEIMAAVWCDARAIASLALEDRARARRELETGVSLLPETPAVVPQLGTALLPLLVALDGGEPDFGRATGASLANGQCAGYLAYARAVHLGRLGHAAEAATEAEKGAQFLDGAPWYLNLMRRLAAEAALQDAWGEPVAWLNEAAPFFDAAGNERLAAACRALLRHAGVRVSRPTHAARKLPETLRSAGVTPREAEVLALVGDGLANRAIATRLFLSERTVEQHVGALKQKLGTRTRAELAVLAAHVAAAG